MAGMNWNSKTRTWTPIVREETKRRARRAQQLKRQGWSESRIAVELQRSPQRVREYLREAESESA